MALLQACLALAVMGKQGLGCPGEEHADCRTACRWMVDRAATIAQATALLMFAVCMKDLCKVLWACAGRFEGMLT